MTEWLESIKTDLLSRRLLPVLVLLGVGLIAAVAYAASGGSSTPASPSASTTTPVAPSGANTLPVSVAPAKANGAVAETPGGTRYQSRGATHNPFTPLPSPHVKQATGASASGSSKGAHPGTGSGTTSSKGAASESTSGSSKSKPASTKPASKPAQTVLTSTESFGVNLSLTASAGGLNTISLPERLSLVPSRQQPLLIYLGVLESGRDALFVVQPGTVVSGPGKCTPGPADCEILALAPDQIESLAVSAENTTSSVALFAVTAIKVDQHASVAAANRTRREVSAAGQALLKASTLPALALFEYRSDLGAVVNLQDLTVGGK